MTDLELLGPEVHGSDPRHCEVLPRQPTRKPSTPRPVNLSGIAVWALAYVDLRGTVQKKGFWHLLGLRAVSRRTQSTHFHVILAKNMNLQDIRG